MALTSAPELNLFGRKDIEASVVTRYNVEQSTSTSFGDGDTLVFDIAPDNTTFIDPNITVKVNLKIVRKNGTELVDGEDNVALVSNSFSSLFSDVTVSCNHVVLNSNNGLYAYSAYVNNVLLESPEKQALLDGSESLMPGKGVHMGVPSVELNKGYASRHKRTNDSIECSLIGRLQHPLFMQDKFLLPNLPIKVQLFQNSDAFRLHYNNPNRDYSVKITDCKLMYTKVVVHDLHMIEIMKSLQKDAAAYPIMRRTTRSHEIGNGLSSFDGRLEQSDRLPSYVIAMLIDTDQLGTKKKSPFESKFEDLSKLALSIDGATVPSIPYTSNTDDQVRMYDTLMKEVKRIHGHYPNISLDDFLSGLSFAIFPLDTGTTTHRSLPRAGSLNVHVRFAKPLTTSKTLICVAYTNATMYVDQTANVILDYVP